MNTTFQVKKNNGNKLIMSSPLSFQSGHITDQITACLTRVCTHTNVPFPFHTIHYSCVHKMQKKNNEIKKKINEAHIY